MKTVSLRVAVILGVFALGCGSQAKPTPQSANQELAASNPSATTNADKGGTIAISEDIRKACGISDNEAYFAFNSARVQAGDKPVLVKLRDCFVKGPLKDKEMRLVGHADPRGDDDYNLALAGSRADSVKQIIVAEGLSATRVQTSSRGKMDAQGTDEATWAKDRRVDVMAGN